MMAETGVAPVLRSVTVRCGVQDAFRIFTEEMGAWWPLDVQSRALSERAGEGVTAKTVVVEPGVGGRLYEVMSDGTEASWGEVLAWEPPGRVVFAWKPHGRPTPPTEVEVRFISDGGRTRVDLEHRGWERLGEVAAEARGGYARGWIGVLAPFVDRADRFGLDAG